MNSSSLKTGSLQSFWWQLLGFATLLLGLLHIVVALFQYVFGYTPFAPYERWFGLILLIIAVISLPISVFFSSDFRQKCKILFKKLCSYEQIFLLILFLWFAIGCFILQQKEGLPYLKAADWLLFDTGISVLILFPLARFLGREKASSLIYFILHLVLISYSLFTAWALWHVFRFSEPVLPSGNFLGMSSRSQLYLGTYYNMTGAIACMMLSLSLYMIISQKLFWKILYGVFFLLHLVVLMLSDSRTAFLGGLFLIVCSAFCFSWYCLGKNKKFTTVHNVLFGLVAASLCGVLFWNLRSVITSGYTAFSQARNISASALSSAYPAFLSAGHAKFQTVPLAREIVPDLNGRTDIWRAALKVITSSPLTFFIGVSPVGLTEALVKIGGISEQFYSTHNVFLDVAVKFGVPVALGFLVFTVKIALRCLSVLFHMKGEDFKTFFMIPLIIITLFVLNLTEGYLIAYYCIPSCIFFLLCGWLSVFDYKSNRSP